MGACQVDFYLLLELPGGGLIFVQQDRSLTALPVPRIAGWRPTSAP